jgi:hypothetical protein
MLCELCKVIISSDMWGFNPKNKSYDYKEAKKEIINYIGDRFYHHEICKCKNDSKIYVWRENLIWRMCIAGANFTNIEEEWIKIFNNFINKIFI